MNAGVGFLDIKRFAVWITSDSHSFGAGIYLFSLLLLCGPTVLKLHLNKLRQTGLWSVL